MSIAFLSVLLSASCAVSKPQTVLCNVKIINATSNDVTFSGDVLYTFGLCEAFVPANSEWSYSWVYDGVDPMVLYFPPVLDVCIGGHNYIITSANISYINNNPLLKESYETVSKHIRGDLSEYSMTYTITDSFIESLKNLPNNEEIH